MAPASAPWFLSFFFPRLGGSGRVFHVEALVDGPIQSSHTISACIRLFFPFFVFQCTKKKKKKAGGEAISFE